MTTANYDQLVPAQLTGDVNQLTISGHVQREPQLSEKQTASSSAAPHPRLGIPQRSRRATVPPTVEHRERPAATIAGRSQPERPARVS